MGPLWSGLRTRAKLLEGYETITRVTLQKHIGEYAGETDACCGRRRRNEVVLPDFLQFYEGMAPDLTCMFVLWTGDPTNGALHRRPTGEHTHLFSTKGRAEVGHCHHDVSPKTILDKGYFHPGERGKHPCRTHERGQQ